jgi:hypothetical protein
MVIMPDSTEGGGWDRAWTVKEMASKAGLNGPVITVPNFL